MTLESLGSQIQDFVYEFNMVLKWFEEMNVVRYWIWDYDFDMVVLCFWYGLGYGLHMFI